MKNRGHFASDDAFVFELWLAADFGPVFFSDIVVDLDSPAGCPPSARRVKEERRDYWYAKDLLYRRQSKEGTGEDTFTVPAVE